MENAGAFSSQNLGSLVIVPMPEAEDCPQGSFLLYCPRPADIFTKLDMSKRHLILTRVDVSKKAHIRLTSAGKKESTMKRNIKKTK